jgi:hypothetical protein
MARPDFGLGSPQPPAIAEEASLRRSRS